VIIDIHRHLWSVMERYPRVREIAARSHRDVFDTASTQEAKPDADARAAELIAEMDASGIDVSVLVAGDYGLRLGEAMLTIEEENRVQARLAQRHPERLVAFFGIDPRRPNSDEMFRTALREWGVKGLKLHPGSGYSPSDRVCFPLYELAAEHGVPVAVHTGPMAAPLLSRTAQPVLLDEAAAEFPETIFIMQHAGQASWQEALNVAFWKPNVMLELSMWQWVYLRNPAEFVAALATMKHMIGTERLLFASDFPGLRKTMSLVRWVDLFRELPDLARGYGADFSETDAASILGGNAARLLGMPESAALASSTES
jgi:predicted TIM-barrel fold metal-dependent hydrolase